LIFFFAVPLFPFFLYNSLFISEEDCFFFGAQVKGDFEGPLDFFDVVGFVESTVFFELGSEDVDIG
jgi:hypothetical protein